MANKKVGSHSRISSLFSLGSTDSKPADDVQSESSRSSGRVSPGPKHLGTNKLSKSSPAGHDRVPSASLEPPVAYPPPASPRPTTLDRRPAINTVNLAEDLEPPPLFRDDTVGSPMRSQPGSRANSRPGTPTLTPTLEVPGKVQSKSKRKSWFGSSDKKKDAAPEPMAWVVGHQGKLPYNLALLLNAERVPELWDEAGDTYVYLFPRTSGKGPSFKIDGSVYNSSPILTRLAYGRIYSNPVIEDGDRRDIPFSNGPPQLQVNVPQTRTPPRSPVQDPQAPDTESSGSSKGTRGLSDSLDFTPAQETHLYLPLALSTDNAILTGNGAEPRANKDDVETLVSVRNLFAFLVGQSLVATEKRPTIFSIFMKISDLLRSYEFTNLDGSTYGEVAGISFDNYVDELHLADVRVSREKTIEGIVLGERMRSVVLYNEAFVHSVGKYDEVTKYSSPKFQLISPRTRNRMERASMDLYVRTKNINDKLEDYEFPAIFAGIMDSKAAEERKIIRFDAWKQSFIATRKHIMGYYRHKYGSWPPKASSKKNNLETSGLNRLVLKDLYHDFSMLYDLLVDRTSLTTRTMEGTTDAVAEDADEPMPRTIRRVLGEYDRSTPPVQPPVPFDVPLLPNLAATRKDYGRGDAKKDSKARFKKLKDEEIFALLKASHNVDSEISGPFIDAFREFERKSAHGKCVEDLCDLRCGQWILMYAVLQSLPMLVVDAPGVKWSRGVEYFLCEPPRSGVPWAREGTTQGRSWYGIQGSSGVVSLPSDIVEHGVEGIYRRSHCWEMANKWSAGQGPIMAAAIGESLSEPLPPPPGMLAPTPRPDSPSRRSNRESVMMIGLEALPLPAGVAPASPVVRPQSSNDPSKTFDAILGGIDSAKPKKGKKK